VIPGRIGLWIDAGLGVLASTVVAFGAVVIVAAPALRQTPEGATPPVSMRHPAAVYGSVVVALFVTMYVPAMYGLSPGKAYTTQMKSDLRDLAMAEDKFYADSGRYTASQASLNFTSSPAVAAPAIFVGKDWWRATATLKRGRSVTLERLRDIRCGIAVGTENPVARAARDGEPACHNP